MRLLHLYEEALPRDLIRAVEEWSALHPNDRVNGRKDFVTKKLLAAATQLQATITSSLGPLFRGVGLSHKQWDAVVNQQQPVTVDWGLLSSWTTNQSTAYGFMEEYTPSVLLEHNFEPAEILFYAPDFWAQLPSTGGSPPAAVHEEEAVVYTRSGNFTIQPNMIVDYLEDD